MMLSWFNQRRGRSAFLLSLVAFSAISCSSSQPNKELGTEICSIYASAVTMSAESVEELADRAEALSQTIRKQLPEFYANHYAYIAAAPPSDQYRLTKMVVQSESRSDWDCPSMTRYLEDFENVSERW